MKYVILKKNLKDMKYARVYQFVFPETLVHAEVARSMQHMIGFSDGDVPDILSGGFCYIEGSMYKTERGSESMKIEKNAELSKRDADILNMPNCMQGMIVL